MAGRCACSAMCAGCVRGCTGGRVPTQPILVELVDRGAGRQELGNCDGTHLRQLWRSGFERGVPSQGCGFDAPWG